MGLFGSVMKRKKLNIRERIALKIIGSFGKDDRPLTEEQLKWNKMWELWTDEKIETPYAELMNYQSEVDNGGHSQYFTNTENNGNLQNEISVLKHILSQTLSDNLQRAYTAYLSSKENAYEKKSETIFEKCDEEFYENEEEINRILEKYSLKIEL